jgi:hypothetical protein
MAALYPGDDILVMVGDGGTATGLMGLSLSVWMVQAALRAACGRCGAGLGWP